MKKSTVFVTLSLAAAVLVALFPVTAMAKVQGLCSECHTMHSSQLPEPAAWTEKGWQPGQTPNVALLATGTLVGVSNPCMGCHQAPENTQNTGSNDIPYVDQTTDPVYGADGTLSDTLAGGTFHYVRTGSDFVGHNVLGVAGVDGTLSLTPPGYDPIEPGLPTGKPWGSQLTCAGNLGCHGDHTKPDQFEAISGGHHGDDGAPEYTDGSSIARSYRFLKGITGREWNTSGTTGGKWEYKPSATQHNQYKGFDRTDDTYPTGKDTISYLCAQCHGFFHSSDNNTGLTSVGGIHQTGSTFGDAWVRHPTDYDMGNTLTDSEYRDYNVNNTYSVVAPVGRSTFVDSPPSTVTFGDDTIVTCISCHRAHGTPWNDLVRWDYFDDQQKAGNVSGTPNFGCFICHTSK